ncbi:MAG TPA: CoA transferase [Kribbella sp.]|nr:CoA transferase [Kribbella sp.]
MSAGPLAGVRVVNLSETVPGPLAALVLADLGADVITVERPPPGDPARRFPAVFAALARNQRSVSLDVADPRGLDLFRLAGPRTWSSWASGRRRRGSSGSTPTICGTGCRTFAS